MATIPPSFTRCWTEDLTRSSKTRGTGPRWPSRWHGDTPTARWHWGARAPLRPRETPVDAIRPLARPSWPVCRFCSGRIPFSCLSPGRAVPAAHAGGGWLLVREQTSHPGQQLLRCRLPAWGIAVRLTWCHLLGHHGAFTDN